MNIAELKISEMDIAQFNILELKGILLGIIEKAKDREQLLRVVFAVQDVVSEEF